ncbi:MAG: adenylyl-sulfate kinase [Sphingobacteriales bacterium]|nr:adenylyl-sulfate kinase [Sphingobacteriales bacterium]
MENQKDSEELFSKAVQLLKEASFKNGIKASLEVDDNYNRVWARDSAVAALSILSAELQSLYPAIQSSIRLLMNCSAENGQIPSNVELDENGNVQSISFGGPVGRTDASFWWLIMAIQFLQKEPNNDLRNDVKLKADNIFQLANAWEFNYKHLMYLPLSGNWADEYVTHGYVLYDQILRFWAFDLAADFFNQTNWKEKSDKIRNSIKQHFLLETDFQGTVFTEAMKTSLSKIDLEKDFISSFTPADFIPNVDAWSVGLLLLLKIPSSATTKKLINSLKRIFIEANRKGIPAFYPFIEPESSLYQQLVLNHNFRFKNYPGHFHNGGIWPVINGFLVAGLMQVAEDEFAHELKQALENQLLKAKDIAPFSEYFDGIKGEANGVKNLCYSASGYILAFQATHHSNEFKNRILYSQTLQAQIFEKIKNPVLNIIKHLNFNKVKTTVVAIAGESGSGKTTLANYLQLQLQQMGYKVMVLHQDEYFKLPPKKNHEARMNDFEVIGPQEVKLDVIDEHIEVIRKQLQNTLAVPYMNWVSDSEESRFLDISKTDVLIVEGTYTSLLKSPDYKLFIDTNYLQTKQNRIKRNREKVTDFIEKVLQKESEIIRSHRKLATLILDNQLNIIS